MSGAIEVPHHDPIILRGQFFRELLAATASRLPNPDDAYEVGVVAKFNGLFFEGLEDEQRRRVACAMQAAAMEMRTKYLGSSAEIDVSFAAGLAEIAMILTELCQPEVG